MPTLTIDGKTLEVSEETRLTVAIEQLGVNIGHRCGGKGKCTTCRVSFVSGEPETMTKAEYDKLVEKGFLGSARLSCQILCSEDMELIPQMTLESVEGWTDTGPALAAEVVPEAAWFSQEVLAQE